MQTATNHTYATNDEEEQLALSLALAASLADAGTVRSKQSAVLGICVGSPVQQQH